MPTTIFSNGSGNPQPIDALFERLETDTLDPSFEDYGNFAYGHTGDDPAITPGHVRFFGNFATYSHVFSVETDDADLIARLTAAIRANQATDAYATHRADWQDRKAKLAAIREAEADTRAAEWAASCRRQAHPADHRTPAQRFAASLADMKASGFALPPEVLARVRVLVGA